MKVLQVLAWPFRFGAHVIASRMFFRRLILIYAGCAGMYTLVVVVDRGLLIAIQTPGVALVSAILVIFTAPLALYERVRSADDYAERELERERLQIRRLELEREK